MELGPEDVSLLKRCLHFRRQYLFLSERSSRLSSYLSPPPILSLVNLSTEVSNELRIYQEHFESAYIEAARDFYSSHAPAYLAENGVQNYMKYVRA